MAISSGSAASKVFLSVALIALAVVGYGIARSLIKRAEVKREVAKLQQDLSQYENQAQELAQLLEYLGTDEYKEREMRLRLGLKQEGEQVVVIPGLAGVEADAVGSQPEPSANWERWFRIFFSQ